MIFSLRRIDMRFSHDLRIAQKLSAIPSSERTSNQNAVKNYLENEYPLSGRCSSEIYSRVSISLRREYNIIHRRIMELLYPLSR